MPEKYEYQGEIYYFSNGHWTDSNHIIVPLVLKECLDQRFGKKKVNSIRKRNRGCRVWVRILPGCYGCRG